MHDRSHDSSDDPVPTPIRRTLLWSEAEAIADFEALLHRNGVEPAAQSSLEAAFVTLLELRDRISADGTVTDSLAALDALRGRIAHGLGILSLIRRLLPALSGEFLATALPHLRLLARPRISAAQNVPAAPSDQATQKLFELLIGAAVSAFATGVVLDPPSGSTGDNPDVLASFDGTRWGLACKTINGDAPQTLADRICDGVEQLLRSEAERGLVVLNFNSVMPYERFTSHVNAAGDRVAVTFDHARDALKLAREFISDRITAADAAMRAEGWRDALYVDRDGVLVPKIEVTVIIYTEITIQVNADDGRSAWQQVIEIGSMGLAPPLVDIEASKFISALTTAMRRSSS